MGNWKRNLRRNFSNKSSRSHQTGAPPSPPSDPGFWKSNVPPWERRFCAAAGVPWGKFLNIKRYIHYNVDVLNWNDSAGEEAFNNAKRRFWEEINCIPCSIPLPDPDLYIDDIDWNPYIDPELIRSLDKEFFALDEMGEYCKLEDSSQKTDNGEGYDMNPASGDDPWELNMQKNLKDRAWAWDKWGSCKNELSNFDKTNSQIINYATEEPYRKRDSSDCPWEYWKVQRVLKGEVQVCNQWGGNIKASRNLTGDDDCWKRSCARASGAVRDDSGGHREDNSWRMWNKGSERINQPRNLGSGLDDWKRTCNQGNEALRDNKCGGWSDGWNYQNKLRDLDTVDNPWEHGCHGAESMGFKRGDRGNNTRGWNRAEKDGTDSRDKSQCWKRWEKCKNDPKRLESSNGSGGWGVWNGGCRKREGSHEHTSSYKCSRVQGDGYQTGHWRRKSREKKRVNFWE